MHSDVVEWQTHPRDIKLAKSEYNLQMKKKKSYNLNKITNEQHSSIAYCFGQVGIQYCPSLSEKPTA